MFFTKRLPCIYKCKHNIRDRTELFQILNSTFPTFGHKEIIMSIDFDLLQNATELDMHLRRQAGNLEFKTDRWGCLFFF